MSRGPVLVVEDDFDVREALLDVLEGYGFETQGACDGVEALALLEGGLVPRVILLDVMMPRMHGIELRDRLLSDDRYATLPVVLLTADRRFEEEHSPSVHATLSKPVDLEELLEVVSRCCEE